MRTKRQAFRSKYGPRDKIPRNRKTRRGNPMKVALTGIILIFAVSALAQKQKLDLKVVDRRDNETDYTYVVPAHFNSYSNSSVNCSSGFGTVDCSGSTTTTGSASPARQVVLSGQR